MMQKDSKLFGTDFGQKVLDASTRNAHFFINYLARLILLLVFEIFSATTPKELQF